MPTEQAISDLVPPLVDHLRAADPDGRWFFQRTPGKAERTLGICFHSTEPVLGELEHLVEVESAKHDWAVGMLRAESAPMHDLDGPCGEFARDLSAASSDFALDLLRNSDLGDSDEQLSTTVRHLGCLVGMTPETDRNSFLFSCWQQAASGLEPAQRIELSRQADEQAARIVRAATADADSRLWDRYLHAVRGITAECRRREDLPTNYLLFDHAHLTHSRLGIPPATEALAARVTRTALRDPELATAWEVTV
ncbi:MAG TPA: lantibiotic dehydratase C-terminal domain-containing protein [Pseudonocardiaceae bacterium]|nr:lantibiotic dehydratase C-terminal domain-containing protein [Pseudonocardiaceae bacterium]